MILDIVNSTLDQIHCYNVQRASRERISLDLLLAHVTRTPYDNKFFIVLLCHLVVDSAYYESRTDSSASEELARLLQAECKILQ